MHLTRFIELFPPLEPPLTITQESVFAFSKENKLINSETASKYIAAWEPDYNPEDDREYIPCFRLSISEDFHTLVYWRAGILNYEYYVITINKKGELIDRRLIAGTIAKSDNILQMVVSIDINYIFFVVAQLDSENTVDLEGQSQSFSLEILPDGNFLTS